MAITRSLRPLAAAALAAGLVLPVAASASAYSGGAGKHDGKHDGVRHASSYNRHQRHKVDGVLATISGTTLTVHTASGTTVTVTVPATTRLERRYNGRSSLDELTEGDRITVYGSFEDGSTNTFDARRIKDRSIAYSRIVGSVAGVWSGGVTLRVARRGSLHSPYQRSQEVSVTLTSSTKVLSGSVTLTAGTAQWTQVPPLHVQVTGLYDSANHTLLANRVRILSGHRQNDDHGVHRQNDDARAAATPVDDHGVYRQNDDPPATATPPATGTPVDDRGGPRQNDDPAGHL
jgi:hypothetical protein